MNSHVSKRTISAAACIVVGMILFHMPARATHARTERVSVASGRLEVHGERWFAHPSLSADGRFVAFDAGAGDLVPADTNGTGDIFVHDRLTGETERVSVSSSGGQASSQSFAPSLSADGRFVAFVSWASNLVPGDTNRQNDVFIHDRETGMTTRVSVSSTGEEADPSVPVGLPLHYHTSISGDGRYVAFDSLAANLVPDDTNSAVDVFVHDLLNGVTRRVSVSSSGEQAKGPSSPDSYNPSFSADGRHVAFVSQASNLVPGDTNVCQSVWGDISCPDVFVHDLETGHTEAISVAADGTTVRGGGGTDGLDISADGRRVVFSSFSPDLDPVCYGNGAIFVHDRSAGQTRCVSVNSQGERGWAVSAGAGASFDPATSEDGRLVVFSSWAQNLVVGDTDQCNVWDPPMNIINPCTDVFLHDLDTGVTVRVSVAHDGQEANDVSEYPAISADGSVVAFSSEASNLVPDDTNGRRDVFVRVLPRTCAGGVGEGGLASGRVHDREPADTPAGAALHDLNCALLVPTGL